MGMKADRKKCFKCQRLLPSCLVYSNGYCRTCKANYDREYRKRPEVAARRKWQVKAANQRMMDRNKAIVVKAKSVPCTDCGGTFPVCCMDFDHREPHLKSHTISHMTLVTEAALRAEMAKCDVVCANCHRIRTWHQLLS
jgi:hypothetical protein